MIFVSIFLLPGGRIVVFPLPIGIPSWLYAVGFLSVSYFALRRRADNIGHDVHLGGAIVGLLVATACYPNLVFVSPWLFASVLVLSLVILFMLILDPLQLLQFRLERSLEPKGDMRFQHYDENNRKRNEKMAEIDRLLTKSLKMVFKAFPSRSEESWTNCPRKWLEGDNRGWASMPA